MIEQVLIKKTLKAGNDVWLEGSIINSPLPKVLIEEVRLRTGTVEVLKDGEAKDKLVFVAQRVDNRPAAATTSTVVKTTPPTVNVLKPKLRRRKSND